MIEWIPILGIEYFYMSDCDWLRNKWNCVMYEITQGCTGN